MGAATGDQALRPVKQVIQGQKMMEGEGQLAMQGLP